MTPDSAPLASATKAFTVFSTSSCLCLQGLEGLLCGAFVRLGLSGKGLVRGLGGKDG